jgi:intracellular sulfur oxidation DsrE/DsrF family protein
MTRVRWLILAMMSILSATALGATWPPARSPAVPQASGFVAIPNAAVPPARGMIYRAVFDATRGADKPGQLVPAIDNAGSELNALAASGLPLSNAKFVIVFHGAAMDAVLRDSAYRSKYGMPNPNLPALATMKKAGVALYVCGQNLAADQIDRASLDPVVSVASDALIVLMTYENRGYALLAF